MSIEQSVVLLREVEEGGGDRQRDHDGVDALGAHRYRTDQRRHRGGDQHRERHQHPPRPTKAVNVHVVGAEDRDRVGGDAGGRDLGEAHHAAVTGEQHHREREQAPDERIGADLGDEELRCNGGIKKQCDRQRDLGGAEPGRDDRGAARLVEGEHGSGRRTRRSHDALRTQRQRDDHDHEREHDAVGRQVDEADLLGQAYQQRPDGGSGNGSHAADDHDHERGDQVAHVLARRERER